MNFYIKKYFWFILLFLIIIITYLPLHYGFISGGDIFYPIHPENFLKTFLSSWVSKESMGGPNSNIADFFLYFFYFVFYCLDISPQWVQIIWYIFVNILISVMFVMLLKQLFIVAKIQINYTVALVATLIYLFNPIVFVSYQQGSYLLAYSFMPLILFASIRIFFYFDKKIIFTLPLLSLVYFYVAVNPPILLASLFPPFIVFVLALINNYRNRIKTFLYAVYTIIIYLICNLFWIIPFIKFTSKDNIQAEVSTSWLTWTSINATYVNIIKFIGSWTFSDFAFGSSTSSLSAIYSRNYYGLIATLFVVLVLAATIYVIKKIDSSIGKIIIISLLGAYLLFMILSAGPNDPFGAFFIAMYLKLPFFWLFREPWVKFTPPMMMMFCLLFALSLTYLVRFEKKILTKSLIFFTLLFLSINIYAMATGHIFPKERGNFPGFYVNIPNYFNDYIKNNCDKDHSFTARTLYLPNNPFYQVHLFWPGDGYYGYDPLLTNICSDIVNYSPGGSYVKSPESSSVITNLYNSIDDEEYDLKKYLAILNIKEILLRYDLDWTHIGTVNDKEGFWPDIIKNIITNKLQAKKIDEFGKIDSKVNLDDQYFQYNIKNKYPQIDNHSAMELFALDQENVLPRIYIPNNVLYSSEDKNELAKIISDPSFKLNDAVVFDTIKENKTSSEIINSFSGDNNSATIEYKRINSTKYKVIIHKAKGILPLIFSETYSDGWSLYSSKIDPSVYSESVEEYSLQITDDFQASKEDIQDMIQEGLVSTVDGSKYISKKLFGSIENQGLPDGEITENWKKNSLISDKKHLVVNGYANMWSLDTDKICETNNCVKNSDGSYEIELSLEFAGQKSFIYAIIISIIGIIIAATGYVIIARKQ